MFSDSLQRLSHGDGSGKEINVRPSHAEQFTEAQARCDRNTEKCFEPISGNGLKEYLRLLDRQNVELWPLNTGTVRKCGGIPRDCSPR